MDPTSNRCHRSSSSSVSITGFTVILTRFGTGPCRIPYLGSGSGTARRQLGGRRRLLLLLFGQQVFLVLVQSPTVFFSFFVPQKGLDALRPIVLKFLHGGTKRNSFIPSSFQKSTQRSGPFVRNGWPCPRIKDHVIVQFCRKGLHLYWHIVLPMRSLWPMHSMWMLLCTTCSSSQ